MGYAQYGMDRGGCLLRPSRCSVFLFSQCMRLPLFCCAGCRPHCCACSRRLPGRTVCRARLPRPPLAWQMWQLQAAPPGARLRRQGGQRRRRWGPRVHPLRSAACREGSRWIRRPAWCAMPLLWHCVVAVGGMGFSETAAALGFSMQALCLTLTMPEGLCCCPSRVNHSLYAFELGQGLQPGLVLSGWRGISCCDHIP